MCVCIYRCSLMGFDLNRHWQDPSPWAHPTLHAVKQLIVQMSQDPVSKHVHTQMNTHTHTHTQIYAHTVFQSSILCSTFPLHSNVFWFQVQFSASLLGSACSSNQCLRCVHWGAWIGQSAHLECQLGSPGHSEHTTEAGRCAFSL